MCMALLSSCHIYRNYQRPEDLPVDSLYQDMNGSGADDSLTLGDLPWQEVFQDTLLQDLIRYGLENNTDMQTALLRVDQAKAQLTAARLSFLPSLTLSPQGTLTGTDGNKAVKTYELPVQASWEIDLFGSLRNAKKGTQAALLEQKAYQQAVRAELIATIANDYFSLLMLDEQLEISQTTLDIWKEQIRTMESKFKVGEETENAITQARASLYELEATHNDLLRQQHEAENALCTLLGTTSRSIQRGSLEEQRFPEQFCVGVPLRLLCRKDTPPDHATPFYWMDFGNAQFTGQVLIGTVRNRIAQPASKEFIAIPKMNVITEEVSYSMIRDTDSGPSCSLTEALHKQDLFINSMLAQAGCEILWKMIREGRTPYRGAYLNMETLRLVPIPV